MKAVPGQSRRRPALVAFDLGGVLVDVDLGALSRRLDRPKDVIEAAYFAGDRHDRLTIGHLTATRFVDEASASLGVGAMAAEEAWADVVTVRPGARELVEAVRADVVAWSNTDPIHVERIAASVPPRLFDRVKRAFSFELGAAKPDARFFESALARVGHAPNDVVFFDDRDENVAAARRLGIDASVVTSLETLEDALFRRALLG